MQQLLNGPNKNLQSTVESVDYHDLILQYVRKEGIPKDLMHRVNFEVPGWAEIVEAKLRVRNSPAMHIRNDGRWKTGGEPRGVREKSNVLFSSVFTNNTSATQTNNLRSERRTTSTCRMMMSKCVTKSGSLSLQIGPPNTCIQANGGFSKECCLSSEGERVMEEELVWSLDTQIIVPPGTKTRADLVITEDEYDGRFQVETLFEGSISVLVKDRKDKSVLCPVIISDLSKVLTPQYGFQPVPGSKGSVVFINEGRCTCSYGIGQRVDLFEEKITS